MTSPANEPTEIAGRYPIIKKLGAGAFGTVFKARDKVLGRMVAIKTIRLEGLAAAGANLDEMVDRFKREAQVSAQLRHPNIVTIYDIGEADGTSYLAMEFIDGVGLDRVIAGAGRLPLERAASLAAQVADALDFAHKNGVVHRDIKPANIMVEAGDRVKVTDFGIAKVIDSADHLTMTGSLLGTPSYMSPEQARGSTLDGRSDLFAVGCIFYEMLAGVKAFRGESITGLIFKIITEEPRPIREIESSVSDEAVAIVSKALSKAPEARFQTGREMADALMALTSPTYVPTVRQVDVATVNIPATPTAVAALQALPTAVPAAHTMASPAAATRVSPAPSAAMPRTPAAVPAPSGGSGKVIAAIAVVGLGLLLLLGGAGWYFLGRKADAPAVVTSLPPTLSPSTTAPAATPPNEYATPAPVAPDATGATTPLEGGAAPPAVEQRHVPPPQGATLAPRPTPAPVVAAPTPVAAAPAGGISPLDEEPPQPVDGTGAGERLAEAYRGGRGGGPGNSRIMRARERSPRGLLPAEKPAVATLRHLIDREEAYYRAHSRYATLGELLQRGSTLDVPIRANGFERRGYRFELRVTSDGFEVDATPLAGGRRFTGDDTGFIRAE